MSAGATTASGRSDHWDGRYQSIGSTGVSWFTPDMHMSVQLLLDLGLHERTAVVDVGGGASVLVDRLVAQGLEDVTVVDVSGAALDAARTRLRGVADDSCVTWVRADVLGWVPDRRWDLWHDRAVFHFLTQQEEVDRYVELAARSVVPGGHVVLGTFAPDGPLTCSGLPVARYSPEQLAAVFEQDFELVTSSHEHHLTPSGTVQSFTWAVLRRRAD